MFSDAAADVVVVVVIPAAMQTSEWITFNSHHFSIIDW